MGSNQSTQSDPYGSRRGLTNNLFGNSRGGPSSFRLAPPRGFVIALAVTAQLVLLMMNAIVTIPLIDSSVPGLTLFTYKAGDGREYSLGSCQVGSKDVRGSFSPDSFACIESLGKSSINGSFKDVPVAMRVTPFWVGLLVGSLLLAREAWSAFRESLEQEKQAAQSHSTDMSARWRAAQTKAWVLGFHLFVIGVIFVQWVFVLACTVSTNGVSVQPLGVGYLVVLPIFNLLWIASLALGSFKSRMVSGETSNPAGRGGMYGMGYR